MGRSISSYFDGSMRKKKNRLILQALKATATRVMFDSTTPDSKLGYIVAYFDLKTPKVDGVSGEIIDRVEVQMDIWEANKFVSQMYASIEAAMPERGGPMRHIPWEG